MNNEINPVDCDAVYVRRRADVELALAERAQLPQVVLAHCRLANAYLDLLGRVDVAAAA